MRAADNVAVPLRRRPGNPPELLAANNSVEEIRQLTGADSLGYLSLEGLIRAIGLPKSNFCMACFTGDYPVPVQLEMDKLVLEVSEPAGEPTA